MRKIETVVRYEVSGDLVRSTLSDSVYFRQVDEDIDSTVEVWECSSCHETFGIYADKLRYCPMCGMSGTIREEQCSSEVLAFDASGNSEKLRCMKNTFHGSWHESSDGSHWVTGGVIHLGRRDASE